jgi:hypothetical protein
MGGTLHTGARPIRPCRRSLRWKVRVEQTALMSLHGDERARRAVVRSGRNGAHSGQMGWQCPFSAPGMIGLRKTDLRSDARNDCLCPNPDISLAWETWAFHFTSPVFRLRLCGTITVLGACDGAWPEKLAERAGPLMVGRGGVMGCGRDHPLSVGHGHFRYSAQCTDHAATACFVRGGRPIVLILLAATTTCHRKRPARPYPRTDSTNAM